MSKEAQLRDALRIALAYVNERMPDADYRRLRTLANAPLALEPADSKPVESDTFGKELGQ